MLPSYGQGDFQASESWKATRIYRKSGLISLAGWVQRAGGWQLLGGEAAGQHYPPSPHPQTHWGCFKQKETPRTLLYGSDQRAVWGPKIYLWLQRNKEKESGFSASPMPQASLCFRN